MQATPTRPHKLERIGRYRIVRPLSKGGMALVYEGRRESLAGVSPRVAIKLILPEHKDSRTFKELFINEARLGAAMQHQNLVGIQDFDCEGDTYFLVMEFVEGLTLRRIIGLCQKHRIGIPLGVIAEIGRQACDGLHFAHCAKDEKGRHLRLVHRDMKPSNLILNPQGVAKVLDFGISKGRLRKERTGSVKGTWGYMAPEQAQGEEVWPSADVFGLGVVLYELASLRPMFEHKEKDEIKRLLADDHAARLAATLDPMYGPIVGVLVRALQRDPRARFESAQEFGRSLSGLLPDPITARDEVVRFFDTLEAFDKGRAPVPGAMGVSQASVAHSIVPFPATGDTQGRNRAGWFLTGAVSTALAVIVTALMAIFAVLLYRDMVVTPRPAPPDAVVLQAPMPPAPVEEPAGPAGVGAPAEQPMPAPVSAPVEPVPAPKSPPVRVHVVRPTPVAQTFAPPKPGPVVAPSLATVPEPESRPVAEKGRVVIQSVQRAEVYIGGQFVQFAPVTQELAPGRYQVSLVAMDGRRRSFQLEVFAGNEVKRTWDFERMEWR